ncbi:hypothetical protein BRD19_03435 [Halobacteriales archaeon SW_7_65_23]|nr:MAG: hypothetical protein BRD19_03435 [Halobacteriales archaeon SW_7_65_23]
MSLKQRVWTTEESDRNRGRLEQLAGFTGLGWTASTLGYLGAALGYGNTIVSRLVTEPQALLYVGGVCLLATLGLDRLTNGRDDG